MKEKWLDIEGYEGLYSVSNKGRVKSFHHSSKGKLLRSGTDTRGYYFVGLYKGGECEYHRVHRLVLAAFIGKPPTGKYEGCHNNSDPKDNRVENLRYGSRQDNEDDKLLHGTRVRGESTGNAVLIEEDVLAIREAYATNKWSQSELAEEYKVDRKTVAFIVRGETWKHIEGPITKRIKGQRARARVNLSAKLVKAIKKYYVPGKVSQARVAEKYDVPQTTISAIVNNKIEKWVGVNP